MSVDETPFQNMSDEEIVQAGRRFGYGNWLQPIINANDRTGVNHESNMELDTDEAAAAPSGRHGRGRPRVTRPRDQSVIEKRRAQVREAQRAYQKRKDTAAATEKRRADELLLLLSDLSNVVESVLQTASKAGSMHREDGVSKEIQRLWHTYDTVINSDSIIPELRLQRIRNSQRQVQHQTDSQFLVREPLQKQQESPAADEYRRKNVPFDPGPINFELDNTNDAGAIQSHTRIGEVQTTGKSIFDIVRERQAAMKVADARQREG